ncbi:MAG: (2Fe-2S)-binding protein [Vulcanimicrobiaceae bacterium]
MSPVPAREYDEGPVQIRLQINGETRAVTVEPWTTLCDALRERLGLTGTKKGCNFGACGACTILVNGKRVLSCLTLAVMHQGDAIVTIEGLGTPEHPHPVQTAFVEHDAMQCGYCTPGQILSAVALLEEGHFESDDAIREWMSGNLCRCAAYPNILAAIKAVAGGRGASV